MIEQLATANRADKTSPRIRVIIADDHPIVRSGIKAELDAALDVEVVGEAANGDEALQRVADLAPDVLILDVNMPGKRTLAVLHELEACLSPRVLILTVEEDVEFVVAMLKAGAKGYLVKDEHPRAIVDGVRAVARGEVWLSKTVLSGLVEHSLRGASVAPASLVTRREMDVLRLVAHGRYNAQIASVLGITEGTVKNHITNLYDKLQVHSRAELVAYAWLNGLVSAEQASIGHKS
jgi:DNA-binding NarL/FixJ family response regulator